MIINEKCYADVKKTLDDLKAKTAKLESVSGGLQHELDIRVRDIEFYDNVASGKHPLPDLQRFKDFALSISLRRIQKGLSAQSIAERAKIPATDDITETQVIAWELLNYLPATFSEAVTAALAIEELPAESTSKADKIGHTTEQDLSDYISELKRAVEKITLDEDDWLAKKVPDGSPIAAWRDKCISLEGSSSSLKDDARFFDSFGEALNMWRVAKKWSYKQLADAAGIEWIVLWHFEKTNYHGAMIGTMLKIAEAVQQEHEPSEHSFEAEAQ